MTFTNKFRIFVINPKILINQGLKMKVKYLNPRYDTTFKMLLESDEFAKELISKIIGREVVELVAEPQENLSFKIEILELVIYRKDYRAKIRTKDELGNEIFETVKIEMQKSAISPNIDRFREYTGAEYAKPDKIETTKTGKEIKSYLPIITIYFIEKTFNDLLPPVLRIGKNYFDVLNQKQYTGKPDKYVEVLTHEAYFIQLEKLPHSLQKEYEILQLFIGSIVDGQDGIIMEIEINEKKYKNSILGRALFKLANKIGDRITILQMNEERRIEQTINDNYYQQKVIAGQNMIIEHNKQEIKHNKQELKQKDKKILELAKMLKENNVPLDKIQEKTELTKQQINNL